LLILIGSKFIFLILLLNISVGFLELLNYGTIFFSDLESFILFIWTLL